VRFWLDLFTPDTWARFKQSGREVAGFPPTARNQAREIRPDDVFICYLIGLSRFCGVLRVVSGCFEDHTAIFADVIDPYPIRFKVIPEVVLEMEYAVPIRDQLVWSTLTFTRDRKKMRGWGMIFRRSLRKFEQADGEFLERIIRAQTTTPTVYPLSGAEMTGGKVRAVRYAKPTLARDGSVRRGRAGAAAPPGRHYRKG
jgi:hypothetical protein